MVQAVASDGTASLPYYVYFNVISPPAGIPAGLLYQSPLSSPLSYVTPAYAFNVLEATDEPVDSSVPIFGGSDIGFSPAAQASAEVDGNGTASADLSAAIGSNFKLAGFDVGFSIVGKPQWTWLNGQWVVSGYVGVGANAELASPPFYFWAVPPLYVQATLNIDTSVSFGIAGWNTDGSPQLDGEWDGNVAATGVLGCGAAGFLAVEGCLGGGPVWKVQYPQTPTLKDLYIQLNGSLKLVSLFWTQDFGLLHYEWCFVGCSSSSQQAFQTRFASSMNTPDAGQWKLMSRDYLKQPYAILNNGKSPQRLATAQATFQPLLLSTIQANVYPYSDPALAASGTNQMLVWVWDNPVRSDENRTELIWSQWNGTSWSNPTSIWEDATADFHPTVKLFPDGSALAAWENEQTVLASGASLTDAVAGLEIGVASYNPVAGVWTPTNLTQNAYLDRSAQLAAAPNGQALLTWISNAGNSLLGATSTPNVVNSRIWNGSSWQDPGPITANAGMLLWSTVAFNGSDGVFLAVIDGDDDQFTLTDEQLYGATFSNSTWSALTQLTSNDMQNAKPQAVYDSTGRLLVAWYQGSNIVIRIGDLNLSTATVVATLSGSSSSKDFRLVIGPNGQVSMVWEDLAADGTGPDPFLLNYDSTLQAWSQPLRLLNTTSELHRSFSGAYSTNGTLLLAYNRVAVSVDSNNVPSLGQVDLMFMNYLIGNDLAVNAIGLSTNNPTPRQSVNVSAIVQNFGELAATNVQAAFYDGNPASSGVQIGSTQTVPGALPAGSNATVQIAWTVPATTSNRTIYVVVDPSQTQADRNLANNTATKTVLAPDLQISGITVLQPCPTNRLISAHCVNTGTIPTATSVGVVFYRGATNGTILAIVPIGTVPTNGVYDAAFEWQMSGVTFTSAFEVVYAVIDPGNVVTELAKDNNTRMVQVMTSLDSDGDGILDGDELRPGSNPYLADTDGNGLPDGWEYKYFGVPTGSDPNADPDGDGLSNLQEYLAGSNPQDGNSVFRITEIQPVGNNIRITWKAGGGRTNIVQSAPSLTGMYSNMSSNIILPGSGDTTTNYLDAGAATNAPVRFYKIRLVP